MNTCDDQRFKGWFFLPDRPDHRVPGILTWSQHRGADLELIGGLLIGPLLQAASQSRISQDRNSLESPRTIFAETDSGQRFALWDAARGNYKVHVGGSAYEESWHAEWVCFGAHVARADQPVFRAFTVVLDELYYLTDDGRFCPPQWVPIEGVDQPGVQQPDGTYLLPYSLPVVGGRRAGVASATFGDLTYRIDTFATRPWVSEATEAMPEFKLDMMTKRRRAGPRIELSVAASVDVASSDGRMLAAEDLLRATSPLVGLIKLTTYGPAGIERLSGKTDDDRHITLLCRTGNPASPDAEAMTAHIAFRLEDTPLQHFFDVWGRLASSDRSLYAWNAVVGLIGHSPLLVEEHIAEVIAAAEGLHRWCLTDGNEMDLGKRLEALHDGLPTELRAQLRLDVAHWRGWAVWARNQVAHGGAKRQRELDDFFDLKSVADSVRLVIYLRSLQEFGVSGDKLATALAQNPRLAMLTRRCSDVNNLPAAPTPKDSV